MNTKRLCRMSAASLGVALSTLAIGAAAGGFSDYSTLARGIWKPVLLPGQRGFVFTIYGAPSELGALRKVVSVMQEKDLGNGFDPGPAARPVNKPVFDFWPLLAGPSSHIRAARICK
jgi:hypothetical protein